MPDDTPLLAIEELAVTFPVRPRPVDAVRGVNLCVRAGEMLGLVGESGSGKSVTGLAVLRLLAPGARVSGRIQFQGRDLVALPEREMRTLRGARIAMVFQDPLSSLNPTLTIGEQIVETLRAHNRMSPRDAAYEAVDWLRRVRIPLPDPRMKQYPMELSGGMRQRVMVAIAFCCRPALLIADEPTTALDVTVQAQVLDLMDDLRSEHNTAVILITHDLAVVGERCSRVAVMNDGRIVEDAATSSIFEAPKHPYTQALLASAIA